MLILGIPEHIDPKTVRPTSEWPLRARCEREHRQRDEMRAKARVAFNCLSDRELQVKVTVDLAETLESMAGGDPPPGFPNASTMTRDEMLDYLADSIVEWCVPDIEVVYPGAVDPTI